MLMRWPSKKTGNREEQLTLSLSKVKKKEEKKQHKNTDIIIAFYYL